jgi:hypothetical protein
MFGTAITLALIGAPVFMQGAVALATDLAPPSDSVGGSAFGGLLIFALSGLPMVLSWLAWRRTEDFRRFLDQGM